MAHGLPRKIKLAFITQALIGSVLISLGILLAGLAVREALLTSRMQDEADKFWAGRGGDPVYPLPVSSSMNGYFVPAGDRPGDDLPSALRDLDPGLHPFPGQQRMVYVDRSAQGTFYVTYGTLLVDRAILYTGLASLLLTLLATYLISWWTYRISKRLVAPVSWLANVVQQWDPRDPEIAAIAPANLPSDAGTEVQRLARALSELGDRVADFIERERDFTRDASHELRTPLTVVRVATDLMLADPDTSARAQRSLARVQRAGRDMEAVIDAFLILAREADVVPQSETFSVRQIAEAEIEQVRPLLAGKPVEIGLVDHGGPELTAPPRVLNVMVGNLLSNAVRFTERGRIDVHLWPDRVEIHDSGIGMTPEVLTKAFNPFYRVDITREDSKGMGLSIVRRLGDRFGWPASLQSVAGEGTKATIRFQG